MTFRFKNHTILAYLSVFFTGVHDLTVARSLEKFNSDNTCLYLIFQDIHNEYCGLELRLLSKTMMYKYASDQMSTIF